MIARKPNKFAARFSAHVLTHIPLKERVVDQFYDPLAWILEGTEAKSMSELKPLSKEAIAPRPGDAI